MKNSDMSSKNRKLERYLQMPTERSPIWLAPDQIAYIRHDENGAQIWMQNLETRERTRLTEKEIRSSGLYSPRGSGTIYFAMDASGSECEDFYRLRPGEQPVRLTDGEDVRCFLGGVTPDETYLVYASNARSRESFDIWRMNLQSGESELIQQFGDHYNWPCADALSPDGRYVLYNKLKGESDNALWLTDLKEKRSYRIPRSDDMISAETEPAWKHDSSGFYLLSDRGSEFRNVCYYDLASEEFTQFCQYGWDAERMALSADDRYLAVFVNENGYTALHIHDLLSGTELQTSSCPRGVLSYYQQAAWSPEGHRLIFTLESGSRPLGLWMLDLDRDSVERLSESELSQEERNGLVEPILRSYTSFDGLEVPYWLYVPRGMKPQNLPVMVEIHGGPEAQEQPSFDAFYQYLLSEGIAIVAPNVRGSTGYGKRYTHLDDVEKRLDSVRDIEELVRHLVETGTADRERLAVSGTSYGGFMTLSCASRYPELWACAVDTVGMYDLVTFLENTADYRRAHRESEYGTLAEHRDILKAVSPVSKIQDITAPIMIIQGKNDPRVPVSEAEQAVDALRKLGRTVEYLCYEDEGHGILKLKNRLDCYPQVASFLKRYLLKEND